MTISASTTGNYSGQISYSFNIIKADPAVSWPEGLTGASGAPLSSVEAGEGFSWQNGEQTIACGANSCALVYTPTDTKNYNTMTNDVTVTGEHSYTNDVCISCGQVIISELSFPDEVFRGCVSELEAASDGVLTPAELEGISEINCYNKGVSTLAGIENFKYLQTLDCAANDLTELDVSGLPALKTLYCHSNKLTKLDVSANTALTELNCSDNALKELVFGENADLSTLYCSNNAIASLDVSGLASLMMFECNNNKLTSLDVSRLTRLNTLYCSAQTNKSLKSLTLNGCTSLMELKCDKNSLTSLDVSGLTQLEKLDCNSNKLTSLDAKNLKSLTELNCSNNALTSLDVSGYTSLKNLDCYFQENGSLTYLGISGCTALEQINCSGNSLTELDLSGFANLKNFFGQGNRLTKLTLDGCVSLERLNLYTNQLTSLDVSDCTELIVLSLESNRLTDIDLSKNVNLSSVSFADQTLDITIPANAVVDMNDYVGDTARITSISPKMNSDGRIILDAGVDKIEYTIATGYEDTLSVTIKISNPHAHDAGDVCACGAVRISDTTFPDEAFRGYVSELDAASDGLLTPAELEGILEILCYNKGISTLAGIENFKNLQKLDCADNDLTELDLSANTALQDINCSNNNLTSLNLNGLVGLKYLTCNDNALTELDLSTNTALKNLYCYDNALTKLNLRANTALRDVNCSNNNLTSLNLNGLVGLEYLNCINNALTELDLGGLPALQILYCDNNALTALDLGANTALESFGCENNKLTSLVFGENEALVSISCKNNALTELDLGGLPALQILYCDNNALTALDLGANTAINTFVSYTQKRTIELSDESSFDMNDLGIDLSKITIASEHTSYENGVVTVDDNTPSVYYTYATGYGENVMYVELVIERSAFRKVNIALGESINVNYYVKCNVDYPELRLTLDGKTVTVEGKYDESGFIKFVFEGVSPQRIGDTIIAELIHDGDVIETKQYSVLEYLNALKAKSAEKLGLTEEKYADMLTLVNDLLVYGGAAQSYTGHNTDALVSEGVTGTQFVPLTQSDTAVNNGDNVAFVGATVYFDSVNKLKFKFTAKNLTEIGFSVSINGTPSTNLIIDYEDNGDGTYVITVGNPIKAYGFDDVYTITACESYAEPTDTVLTYSVKSYVYAMQNADGPVAELVKALYNYGLSAKKYSGIN